MTAAGGPPVPAPSGQAQAAVDRHLARILGGRTLESAGWDRPDPLTLYVPLRGYSVQTSAMAYGFDPSRPPTADEEPFGGAPAGDDYLLRLYFGHYPEWPPSARFVNPATQQFGADDRRWLPMINGANELHVHASYGQGGEQLICCSATLEFYLVSHSVEEKHRWRPGSSFAVTLNTVSRYLRPPSYTGRQQP